MAFAQKLSLLTCLHFLILVSAYGQKAKDFTFPNGAKAAICLTYDDGLPSHVQTVGPALNKYGLKGTFFITVNSASLQDDMDKWRALATAGHELANHSVYHPCRKSLPGMDWVRDYYNLDGYTVEQVLAELKVANGYLQALDGKRARTYAYPCAHLFAGGVSFKDSIVQVATAARGVHDLLVPIKEIDLNNVASYAPNGVSGQELIAYVQRVIEQQTLGTFCFHGVGAEYLSVSKEAHEELLQWLAGHRKEVWVATFEEATGYVKANRN
ncbi:MAG: polysaccharide deacetylase family protein [Saprospiraceae bacterium]|nr:polysaccharide deacetylase family protein [Saprospiraceae bacterium]